MGKPIRIQRSRQHKQISPNGLPILYVGRSRAEGSGKFGNPFKVGNYYRIGGGGDGTFMWIQAHEGFADNSFTKMETIEQCVEWFAEMIKRYPISESRLNILKGKNLSCWCALDKPCHADILLKLANN